MSDHKITNPAREVVTVARAIGPPTLARILCISASLVHNLLLSLYAIEKCSAKSILKPIVREISILSATPKVHFNKINDATVRIIIVLIVSDPAMVNMRSRVPTISASIANKTSSKMELIVLTPNSVCRASKSRLLLMNQPDFKLAGAVLLICQVTHSSISLKNLSIFVKDSENNLFD